MDKLANAALTKARHLVVKDGNGYVFIDDGVYGIIKTNAPDGDYNPNAFRDGIRIPGMYWHSPEDIDSFQLPVDYSKDIPGKLANACDYVSKDDDRPGMQCIALYYGEIVATDGMRLMTTTKDIPDVKPLLFPAIKSLYKAAEAGAIVDGRLYLVNGDTHIIIESKDESYPNVKAVISDPKKYHTLPLPSKDFMDKAVKAARHIKVKWALVCSEGAWTYQGIDIGRYPVETDQVEPIGFNPAFLKDLVDHGVKQLLVPINSLACQGDGTDGFHHIIMPMRLD